MNRQKSDERYHNQAYVNRFIDNDRIKSELLDYIYNKIDLSNYKYKLIETVNDLNYIKDRHIISPNYNGINCLLVFVKLADKYFSFLVDRKTLSYNRGQIELDNVKFTPVNIRLDLSIYRGTIMDGVFICNKRTNNRMIFIVNDLYYFRGDDMLQYRVTHKNINISTYLDANMIDDQIMNTMILQPNKYFDLEEIKRVIDYEIPKMKYSSDIKGLTFYPQMSGMRVIFLYSNAVVKNEVVALSRNEKINEEYNNENIQNGSEAVFELRSGKMSDVYKLYLLKKIKKGIAIPKGNEKLVKNVKMGLAYIPTKTCADMCRTLIEQSA